MNGLSYFRSFSRPDEAPRDVEEAPDAMRQELADCFFSISEHNHDEIPPEHVYQATCQSLGIATSGTPYGGYRYATGRDLRKVDWRRIFDLIARLHPDFARQGFESIYRNGVNRILAAYRIAWELDDDGRIVRVLPESTVAEISAAMVELQKPRYEPALELFDSARDAYDDRPRRDRDACSNMFDAMESVAKEIYKKPNATLERLLVTSLRREL